MKCIKHHKSYKQALAIMHRAGAKGGVGKWNTPSHAVKYGIPVGKTWIWIGRKIKIKYLSDTDQN